MKVVARALKTMEANKYAFGAFLPTLFGLRMKLAALEKKATQCLPLVKTLQSAFEKRFGNVMDIFDSHGESVPAYVAMASNPNYKLNYMGMKTIPTHILLRIKQMLLDAAMDILKNGSEAKSDDKSSNPFGNYWLNGICELLSCVFFFVVLKILILHFICVSLIKKLHPMMLVMMTMRTKTVCWFFMMFNLEIKDQVLNKRKCK